MYEARSNELKKCEEIMKHLSENEVGRIVKEVKINYLFKKELNYFFSLIFIIMVEFIEQLQNMLFAYCGELRLQQQN